MPRYIDANEFKRKIEQYLPEDRELALKVLKTVPTADVRENVKGEWIDDKGVYLCSACNHLWVELWWTSIVPKSKMYKWMHFCPNCGAVMDERGEDGEVY